MESINPHSNDQSPGDDGSGEDEWSDELTQANLASPRRSSRPPLKIPSIVSLNAMTSPEASAEHSVPRVLALDEAESVDDVDRVDEFERVSVEEVSAAEISADEFERVSVEEIESEPEEVDPWRDEVPTLVFDRAVSHSEPPPADDLSVVFRGAASRAPSAPPPPLPAASGLHIPPPPHIPSAGVPTGNAFASGGTSLSSATLPGFPAPLSALLPAASIPPTLPPPAALPPPTTVPGHPVAQAALPPLPAPAPTSTHGGADRSSVRPLLPPPPEAPIPRAPRVPSHQGRYGGFGASDVDSIRPLALDNTAPRPRILRRPQLAPWQLAAAAVLGGASLFGGFAWWEGRHGELVVDIADQECGSLEDVRVFVDDELRCTSAPCTLRVRTGGHLVRAEVDGYTPAAARAVFVDADMPALHKIQTGVSDRTAIEVRGASPGGQLYIDGSAEGLLPKRVTGLTRGEHLIQVRDTKGAVALERTVFLEEEQLLVLDLAVPPPNAEPQGSPEQGSPQGVAALPELPSGEGAAQTGNAHAQSGNAQSRGAAAEAGQANPSSGSGNSGSELLASAQSDEARGERAESGEGRASVGKRGEATGESGVLRLTASPPAMVLLDGRPLGPTPQRVNVDPGPHTVIFVHPEHGRSRSSVNIKPGQSRKLHARF